MFENDCSDVFVRFAHDENDDADETSDLLRMRDVMICLLLGCGADKLLFRIKTKDSVVNVLKTTCRTAVSKQLNRRRF